METNLLQIIRHRFLSQCNASLFPFWSDDSLHYVLPSYSYGTVQYSTRSDDVWRRRIQRLAASSFFEPGEESSSAAPRRCSFDDVSVNLTDSFYGHLDLIREPLNATFMIPPGATCFLSYPPPPRGTSWVTWSSSSLLYCNCSNEGHAAEKIIILRHIQ